MTPTSSISQRVSQAINRQRLLDTAVQLIAVPSRTGDAGGVLDCLASILDAEKFVVERPSGGHVQAPAVVARYQTGRPGRTLQFNGHLDTVHLPFVPPQVDGDRLTGSGSSDMKAGLAAAVEAMRVLRELDLPAGGTIMLCGHDLHESPWGDNSQLERLIAEGIHGDAVLLPEYLHDCLPAIGRGGLVWRATIRRPGPPVHEVLRPRHEPSVIAVAAELVGRLSRLDQRLTGVRHPIGGSESLFIGQVHAGEIYNQYPQECLVEGTRRWLPGTPRAQVERELTELFAELAGSTGTTITSRFNLMRDAFLLDEQDPLVAAFQEAHTAAAGQPLPIGAKPFCDDGNSFWSQAKVPAITHGPRAGGAHTLSEWVSITDLVRVAQVYALTAIRYCPVG